MKITNIINLFEYFKKLNYNCTNWDILENFLIFENVTNKDLRQILFELQKLNLNIVQLHYAKNKDLIICIDPKQL